MTYIHCILHVVIIDHKFKYCVSYRTSIYNFDTTPKVQKNFLNGTVEGKQIKHFDRIPFLVQVYMHIIAMIQGQDGIELIYTIHVHMFFITSQ